MSGSRIVELVLDNSGRQYPQLYYGTLVSVRRFDTRSNAKIATSGSAGGLLGTIHDYMRSNAY
jgi:hypothetical protein